jgi:GNAT superfamily N-acetyltransferase
MLLFGPIGGLLALWRWVVRGRVIVRPAVTSDVRFIADYMGHHWNLVPEVAANDANDYIARREGRAAFVAEVRGKPVGMGLFDLSNHDVSAVYGPWLTLLWVEPSARGRGIGWEITRARLNYARDLGHRSVFLDTAGAEQYHLKRGWRRVDTADYHGTPVAILRFDLPGQKPI